MFPRRLRVWSLDCTSTAGWTESSYQHSIITCRDLYQIDDSQNQFAVDADRRSPQRQLTARVRGSKYLPLSVSPPPLTMPGRPSKTPENSLLLGAFSLFILPASCASSHHCLSPSSSSRQCSDTSRVFG